MQRINLYRDINIKISDSLLYLIKAVGIAFGALIILSAGLYINLMFDRANLADLIDSKTNTTRTLENESAEIVIPREDASLVQKIATLKEQRKRKKAIDDLIQNQDTVINSGFYQAMLDLYEYDTKGVWLNKIKVEFPGPQVILQGWVSHPEELPIYISSIRETSTFTNIEYDVFEIKPDEDNPNLLSFTLATTHEQLQSNAPNQLEQILRAVQ